MCLLMSHANDCSRLTFTSLKANSADDELMIQCIFSYFSQKSGFEISCSLSLMETVCMKCQILFSGKNKENISKCYLLKILPRRPSINGEKNLFFSIDLVAQTAGPCSLVDGRVILNPLGFSPLWFEPRLGHMWERQVLLTDGQKGFPRILRFLPTFDERLDTSEIFLKRP